MQEQLPLVFDTSFEDKNLLFKIERFLKESTYNEIFVNLVEQIIKTFDCYTDKFLFDNLLYQPKFKIHIEFEHTTDIGVSNEFIEALAKLYDCNYVDANGDTTVCISMHRNIPVTFPKISGAYYIDENKHVSNCMFFIIIPVP